jgi:glycosyltransferase involved in cell wall biosynthesis
MALESVPEGAVDLAVTDDPLTAGELAPGFAGRLPIWLDLDGDPDTLAVLKRRARRALGRADLVTVATRGLWELVREIHHNVVLIPEPIAAPARPAAGVEPLLRPAVGYLGRGGPWMRLELLSQVAATRRELQVYLAGECAAEPVVATAAARLPNLHRLAEAEASLWRRLSVAAFAYRTGRVTETWLPTALLAALAAGVPIVATPLLELGRLPTPALFATTAAGFAGQVDVWLADPETAAEKTAAGRAFIAAEHAPEVVAAALRDALATTGRG